MGPPAADLDELPGVVALRAAPRAPAKQVPTLRLMLCGPWQAAARAARARLSHALAAAGAALARLAAYLGEPPGASPAAALAALAAFRGAFDRSYAHVASQLAQP